MKKEVLIAITLGLVVGLVITIGMYRARTAVQTAIPGSTFEPVESPILEATEVPEQKAPESLIVASPLDESLSSEGTIRVTGTTFPSIPVVILHNDKEFVTKSDPQGNFSISVQLVTASNIFKIRALPENIDPIEVIRTVIYSSPTVPVGSEPTATSSGVKKTP